jgi:hypothetical protein
VVAVICASVLAADKTQAQSGWPANDYGISVGMPTGDRDPRSPGMASGHSEYLQLVERAAFSNRLRRPNYFVLHCPGVCPLIEGDRQFVFNGFELAMTGTAHLGGAIPPSPRLVSELPLWGDFARRYGMEAWIYLGQLTHPLVDDYRQRDPVGFQRMVRSTFQLVHNAGFAGAFIDASGNPTLSGSSPPVLWGPTHPAIQLAVREANLAGVKLGVEAWPHARMEPVFAGAPVYLMPDAFESQHPLVTDNRWGQASADSHRSVVVVMEKGQPLRTLAWRVARANGMLAVPFHEWPQVAYEMSSARGRPVYAPPTR